MKYKAHLDTGRIIDMSFADVHEKDNILTQYVIGGWLVDDNGVMVNIAHLIALEPVPTDDAPAPNPVVIPLVIIDDAGDRWMLTGNGRGSERTYSFEGSTPHTREQIEKYYGVREVLK